MATIKNRLINAQIFDVKKTNTLYFQIMIFLISLTVCLNIAARGLDITDESLYILSAKYPHNLVAGLGFSQFFTAPLWSLGQSIFVFRLISIGISLVISLVLVLQVKKIWGGVSNKFALQLYLFISLGFLAYGALINFSPSYNLLVAWLTPITALALLIFLNSDNRKDLWFYGFMSLLGELALVNIKIPTAISLLILIFASWILMQKHNSQIFFLRYFFYIFLLLTSIAVELMIIKFLGFDFTYFTNGIRLLREIQTEGSIYHLIVVIGQTMKRFGIALAIVAVWFFLSRFLKHLSKRIRFLILLLYIVSISIIFRLLYASNANWTGQAIAFHILILFSIFSNWDYLLSLKAKWQFFTVLAVLPYVMSFGTNNVYFEQILFYLSPWLIFIAFADGSPKRQSFAGHKLVASVLIALHLITAYLTPAYGIGGSYKSQAYSTKLENYGEIRLSKVDRDVFKILQSLPGKCGFRGDSRFLGFTNLGGLAIPLGLQPLGNSWITTRFQADLNLKSLLDDYDLVMAIREPIDENKALIPSSLHFPDGFSYCGTFKLTSTQPFQIWTSNL